MLSGQQLQQQVEEAAEVEGALQPLCTLAELEEVVKTLDLVAEEAETGPYPQNWEAAVVGSSSTAEEAEAANQSQRPEEGAEGSLVGPLRSHPWVEAGVEEGGCPLQVEGSWLAGVAGGEQVLHNSWLPKEVVEGALGLEVVVGESQLMVGVEVEVEVGYFRSPEKTEYKTL